MYIKDIEEFNQLSLVDTVQAMVKTVNENTDNKVILAVIDLLNNFAFNKCNADFKFGKDFKDKYCVGFDKDHMLEGVDGSSSYEAYLFGEQATRSLAMLACLTGNVGIKGGGSGASIWEDCGATINIPTLDNPFKGEIPNFLWSKTVDRGTEIGKNDGLVGVDKLDSGIKMIFNLAGNTLINQHSNVNETARILQDESK